MPVARRRPAVLHRLLPALAALAPTALASCRAQARRCCALLLAAAVGLGAAAQEFEVSVGYLSTNVGALATNYGWSLVWEADEDRLVEHPFVIPDDSLQGALEGLLGAYRGTFVADLYRSNKVVVVSTPLPQVQVALPGDDAAPLVRAEEPSLSAVPALAVPIVRLEDAAPVDSTVPPSGPEAGGDAG